MYQFNASAVTIHIDTVWLPEQEKHAQFSRVNEACLARLWNQTVVS